MAKELKDLTKRADNYSQWFNDLVVKADLAEQSAVRGCMVIKPYGYAIWVVFQRLDSSSRKVANMEQRISLFTSRLTAECTVWALRSRRFPSWLNCF